MKVSKMTDLSCVVVASLVSLVAVPLVQGYKANNPYPTFQACNKDIIAAIMDYGNGKVPTPDEIQAIQSMGAFTVMHTSYTYLNSDNKCQFIKFTDKGTVELIFIPKNGGPIGKLEYNSKLDSQGVIVGWPVESSIDKPEHRWNMYGIYFGQGIISYYVCGIQEGSKQPPQAEINVLKASYNNSDTRDMMNKLHTKLTSWGFDVRVYEGECLTDEIQSLVV